MKKTLYIPTTTLNFNNILSSESVSPKSFYKERGFGYSRWFTVGENCLMNAIVLYESKVYVRRDNSELEDHPMLIEVCIDVEGLRNPLQGVYLCDHTIYLNPWMAKFIFFDEKDKATTLSLSDSSMETKLLRLYRNRLVVENPDGFQDVVFGGLQDVAFNADAVKKDIVVNKLKGLLYGYYIGANISVDEEGLAALNDLKEIRSILCAINTSVDKNPSSMQRNRLAELVGERNNTLPVMMELRQSLPSYDLLQTVIGILSKYDKLPELWDADRILCAIRSPMKGTSNLTIGMVTAEIDRREAINGKTSVLLSPSASEIVCLDGKLHSIDNKVCANGTLFKAWVDEVLIDGRYDKNISTYRKDLADAITYKAKEVLGDGWQDSYERIFLNKLRKHLGGGSFDEKWTNGLLPSVAAVILSGDDWNKMLNFLQVKGMNDYRLAFALYGELVGFANMVRDFTDILLNNSSVYLVDVYKEFYEQLHNESPVPEKTVHTKTRK